MVSVLRSLFVCLLMLVQSSHAQSVLAAARIDDASTTASFTLGLSRDNGASFETTALTTDNVRLIATITPETAHLEKQADIYVVAQLGAAFYMRNQNGGFESWNGELATLKHFQTQVLSKPLAVDVFSGSLPAAASMRWFVGYKTSDDVLIYSRQSHQVVISQPSSTPPSAWPSTRPFISLVDFKSAAPGSAAHTRFMGMVDKAVGGNKEYGYSSTHSVIAYALKGDAKYIQLAIADTDAYVEAQIASACGSSKNSPAIGGDSYLGSGGAIQNIALTYDYGYDLLTDAQRTRWLALMTQVADNIWGKPSAATWGGPSMGCAAKTVGWSGWSISNAGNNYYYTSFARVAMYMALVTHEQKWIDLVQQKVIPSLVTYYSTKLLDGGSREGTGYGAAHMTLFDIYRLWLASTGEDLATRSSHTQNTINYWLHATVPTLDRFVPIGDQSRTSHPTLYDYHRILMLEAQLLSPNTPEAEWAHWWLDNNAIKKMTGGFNSQFDLLKLTADSEKPTELSYYAKGAGVYFARSSWEKDATHFSMIAGQYEEAHAGQEQGNFTFFKNNWLAVTSNIWSRTGINQDTASRNVLRFDNANGEKVRQNKYADSVAPVIVVTTDADGTQRGVVDLSPAFSVNRTLVQSWKRDFVYKDNKVTIHDRCQVSPSITPVWQVHTPVLPNYDSATGKITTADGKLVITPQMSAAPRVVIEEMKTLDADYAAGRYRVSLYSNSGCDFTVELLAL
jgi:hypothetical protein